MAALSAFTPSSRRGRPSWAMLALGVGLGAMAALGQAPWDLWPLTLLALALLCRQVARAETPRAAAWHAFAAGLGHFALAMAWIVEPFLVEPETYGWMAPFALVLTAAGGALFWTVPAWLAVRLAPGFPRQGLGFAALMVLKKPIDFEAVDDLPVDVVFLLLSSPEGSNDYLKILAAVARRTRDEQVMKMLRGAKSEHAAYSILVEQPG